MPKERNQYIRSNLHYDLVESEGNESEATKVNIALVHCCELCNYTTIRKDLIEAHVSKHSIRRFSSDICTFNTYEKSRFMEYLGTQTAGEPCSPARNKQSVKNLKPHRSWNCAICNHKCEDKKDLVKVHMKYCHVDKPIACALCDYRANGESLVLSHIGKIHGDGKYFSCSVCGFKYSRRLYLERHMKSHDDVNKKNNNVDVVEKSTLKTSK